MKVLGTPNIPVESECVFFCFCLIAFLLAVRVDSFLLYPYFTFFSVPYIPLSLAIPQISRSERWNTGWPLCFLSRNKKIKLLLLVVVLWYPSPVQPLLFHYWCIIVCYSIFAMFLSETWQIGDATNGQDLLHKSYIDGPVSLISWIVVLRIKVLLVVVVSKRHMVDQCGVRFGSPRVVRSKVPSHKQLWRHRKPLSIHICQCSFAETVLWKESVREWPECTSSDVKIQK